MRQLFFAVNEGPTKTWAAKDFDTAWAENEKGANMYWTVNEFHGTSRTIKELKTLHYVAADFDHIDKQTLFTRLKKFPRPTMVVETGKGFHVYWWLKSPVHVDDPVRVADEYKKIIEESLVPIGADPNAKDAARVLRYPDSIYWKDGKNIKRCSILVDDTIGYSWADIRRLFPKQPQKPPQIATTTPKPNHGHLNASGDFWVKANSIPVVDGLKHLSGSTHVNGETYTFKNQSGITRIIVDNKPSAAWVDKEGRIGSSKRAGPFIPNWLTYFGHNWATIADIMKKEFNL
jgi:hypothetical protein